MRFLRPLISVSALIAFGGWGPCACGESPARSPRVPATQQEQRAAADRQAPRSLFDPARHMRVSEVRPGMKGYGLSVFSGTKIERFDVEVISILKNFNPQADVVLIRCKGAFLDHTGSIEGMSGSPIFLTDANGHDRMIGAFAYGWPMAKDPVGGVQPIEYMLQLPMHDTALAQEQGMRASAPPAAGGSSSTNHPDMRTNRGRPNLGTSGQKQTWSLARAGLLPVAWRGMPKPRNLAAVMRGAGPDMLMGKPDEPCLEPLATPLMISGMSGRMLDSLGPVFHTAGLSALQAGNAGARKRGGGTNLVAMDSRAVAGDPAAPAPNGAPNVALQPGSAMMVPLLTGDVDMTAIGTCTEVIGDRVWGFGHSFNNEGVIALPMASGEINGVIAGLQTSFKLGSIANVNGTLLMDGEVGVAGRTGIKPPVVPIELAVDPADGSAPRIYHFQASLHPKLTPLIAAAALGAAAAGTSDLPQYNTVDYDLTLTFNNGQTITTRNRTANATAADLFGDAAVVMQAAADNPFQRVLVKSISGSVKVRRSAEAAQILDVNLPRGKYHPGDTIKAFVSYQLFRGAEGMLPIELELPRDLPQGAYQLVISDAERFVQDEQQSKPFQFTAENIKDVFSVLRDVTRIRENAIYVRLLRHPDGVAIGHTAMPRLPSSRRQILLGSGRSNTTAFVSSTVKTVPTPWVMSGSAEFVINVERASKVTLGSAKPPHLEPTPPRAKTAEPRKAPGPTKVLPGSESPSPTPPNSGPTPQPGH